MNYISWNYHSDLDKIYRDKICNLLINVLINKKNINNIGTKWINLLEPYFLKDNEDEFLNIISEFIKKLRENDIFDRNIQKNKEYQKIINNAILEKINELIQLTFIDKNEEIPNNKKNDIFVFFKDLKKAIKDILNDKIKDKYKNYFINGKYSNELISVINDFLNTIKEKRKNLDDNYKKIKTNEVPLNNSYKTILKILKKILIMLIII